MAKKKKKSLIKAIIRYIKKNKRKRKKKNNKTQIIILLLLILFTLFLKRNAIKLQIKGYSKEDRKILLQLDKIQLKEYFTLDTAIELSKWNKESNQNHYYDYNLFQNQSNDSIDYIIQQVDSYYKLEPQLTKLGYSKEFCRDHYGIYDSDDYNILIQNNLSFEKTKEYITLKGCQIEDINDYIDSQLTPIQAITTISYPFINSENGYVSSYLVKDPAKYDVLLKAGFTLGSDYTPSDLKEINLPLDAEIQSASLRKKAATALEEMAKDAAKEGLSIGVRSAYRSYKNQEELYSSYVEDYGYSFASTLVSVPGSSEHQLGLGVDLTSQSVINGEIGTFRETAEYNWTIEHAHEYGFILRYPDDKISLTGSQNEPWHFRYVGKEIAKECHNNNWTLEEYILNHGFDYNLIKQ